MYSLFFPIGGKLAVGLRESLFRREELVEGFLIRGSEKLRGEFVHRRHDDQRYWGRKARGNNCFFVESRLEQEHLQLGDWVIRLRIFLTNCL